MASFESKVSRIFDEFPKLARNIPHVIRKIYNEPEFKFKQRLSKASPDFLQTTTTCLFDILFHDFYFKELNDHFLSWVIKNYPGRFDNNELTEMRLQSVSYLDFYEIQEVIPGKGSRIKSLFTDYEGFLNDKTSSHAIVKWDIVMARCYPMNGMYYMTGTLVRFRPSSKKFILERIGKAFSEYSQKSQTGQFSQFSKNNWDVFFQIEREIFEMETNKKIYTKYGEFQFCEVRFKTREINSILNKTNILNEFRLIETKKRRAKKKTIIRYEFDWLNQTIEDKLNVLLTGIPPNAIMLSTGTLDSKGNQTREDVLGTFYVDPLICRLETQSVELAEFAASHFVELFDNALTLKRIIKKKAVLNTKQQDSLKTENNIESISKMQENFNKKYYLNLLNEKIPFLNNLSPHEARKDPASIQLLIDWLKGLENRLEESDRGNKGNKLINKIKKELDIDF